MKSLAALVWAAVLGVTGASAQNQQFSTSPAMMTSVSPAELIAILTEVEFNASYKGESGGSHIIEVNEDGAFVYFSLEICEGAGLTARCGLLQPFGFFDATGVTFGQVNDFNLERSKISMAGLLGEGEGIIATKIYTGAGVSQDHLTMSMGLFFMDLDTIIAAIYPGAAAQVSYKPAAQTSKISNIGAGAGLAPVRAPEGDWAINSVGVNAPTFMTERLRQIVENVEP